MNQNDINELQEDDYRMYQPTPAKGADGHVNGGCPEKEQRVKPHPGRFPGETLAYEKTAHGTGYPYEREPLALEFHANRKNREEKY